MTTANADGSKGSAQQKPPVYTRAMLLAAMELADYPLDERARFTADGHSRTCGSRVTISLDTDGQGKVSRFGISAQACAFGQASAAVLARHINGRSAADIRAAADALSDYLQGRSDDIGNWPGIAMLAPARDLPARRDSMLLPYTTALKALHGARD